MRRSPSGSSAAYCFATAAFISLILAEMNAAISAGAGPWEAGGAVSPPAAEWRFEDGLWLGRIPAGAADLDWGVTNLPVAAAQVPPLAPTVLPATRNAFGPCVLEALSLRYESVARSRPWTIVFSPEGEEPALQPLEFPDGRRLPLALSLEDVESGQRWVLRPMRQGRDREGGEARFYGGLLDNGDIDWSLIVAPASDGRQVLQCRLMLAKRAARLFRVRVLVLAGTAGRPLLQEESPPAVEAAIEGGAVALFDPAIAILERLVNLEGRRELVEIGRASCRERV